ncbi:CYFA0S01e04236g1_1 [Cyberlindnera fabianii]|uniref:CYFA0S01e04236g1_1 n=1 Tax=Cyberlindnera fabianii TaxID=36022 RepID=A0A061APV7_CYBFA|nr:CYFA0S01e04236g1_1 [Cyberlindnera fabianii]
MEDVYRQFEARKNGLENVFESYLDQKNQDKDERIHEIQTEIDEEDKERLTMQAKTFYFCRSTGNIMNIEDYQEWKSQQKDGHLEEAKKEVPQDVPEYSSNYNQIVEMILAGKEKDIPGIMQIPDTVLEGQSSESGVQTRKKPWEIAQETTKEEKEEF